MIHVVLYNPEIPQNTGNIMRTCAATDTKLHLIEPLGFSFEPKYLKRDTAGYIDKVDYVIHKNWEEFLKAKTPGKMYFLTRYGHKTPREFDLKEDKEDIYLVFGAESCGIPKEILHDHLDTCMRLPMNDKVRSLNLSNTVAIMVYEALAQNSYYHLLHDEPNKDLPGFKGADFLERE